MTDIDTKQLLARLYSSGYQAGHNDTVEACFTDVHHSDRGTYHLDQVDDFLSDYPELRALLDELDELRAACAMKDSRIDWTVEDNAEKAIELVDLRAANAKLHDAHLGQMKRANDLFAEKERLDRLSQIIAGHRDDIKREADELRAENERLLAALDAIEQLHRAALEEKP